MRIFGKAAAAFVLAITCSLIPAGAFADEVIQDGFSASVATDKQSYETGEAVKVSCVVTNVGADTATNVKADLSLPDGFVLQNETDLALQVGSLAPGESKTLEAIATLPSSAAPAGQPGSETSSLNETGDNSAFAFVAAVAFVAAALLIVSILLSKKARSSNTALCLLLSVCLCTGSVPLVSKDAQANAAEAERGSLSVSRTVAVSGTDHTFSLGVSYDARKAVVENGHTATFMLRYDEMVENAASFASRTIADGDTLTRPEDPRSQVASFEGWYSDVACTQPYDFEKPVTEDVLLVAKWEIDTVDNDGDGLYNGVEAYLGTDKDNPDTDGDGLSDGIEVKIGTSPIKTDTDGNGVSDFDEDADSDGVSNGAEVAAGTGLTDPDTDGDSLSDGQELNEQTTDPLKPDTDGDGADDGWEVLYGFDPLTFNSSFSMKESSEALSEGNRVSASAEVVLSGNQIGSLSIQKASVVDNPLVSPSIAGYMGSAYEFNVDGSFESAVISFSYSEDYFGSPDEDFQPRIYYVDEGTGCLEKLEGQVVEGNTVKASVAHFSTYILLNEIPFDKVWDAEIAPPLDDGETGNNSLDIVFALDYSNSMVDNDPYGLRKDVTKLFIDKLRDCDKAGVVSFVKRASVLSELTADKAVLKAAVDSIVDDSGWETNSGTNGSEGIRFSIDTLSDSKAKNKYIVFLTDGEDTETSYPYDDLIAEAKSTGVVIYSIGLGSANESLLKKIADGTGGKYYKAIAGMDLDDIYKDIESETIDLTTDSNADGIPDYYNELIRNGTLVLSNGSRQFCGIDFNVDRDGNPSADYDGDGLLNGEELEIVTTEAGGVYLKMNSDPTIGIPAGDHSSELSEKGFSATDVEFLLNDANYYYEEQVRLAENDWLTFSDAFLSKMFGTDRDAVFREKIIGYIDEYAIGKEDAESESKRRGMLEVLYQVVAQINTDAESTGGAFDGSAQLIGTANDLIEKLLDARKTDWVYIETKFESFMEIAAVRYPDATYSISVASFSKLTIRELNLSAMGKDLSSSVDKFCRGISVLAVGLDAVKSITDCAKVSADNTAFSENIEFLYDLKTNSNDGSMRSSASLVLDMLTGNYATSIEKIVYETGIATGILIVEQALAHNPYVFAVVFVKDLCDLAFGIGDEYENKFKMLCSEDMSDSAKRLFYTTSVLDGSFYWAKFGKELDATKFLSDLAQLRTFGERACYDHLKLQGWLGCIVDIFGGNDKNAEDLLARESMIKVVATENLTLKLKIF